MIYKFSQTVQWSLPPGQLPTVDILFTPPVYKTYIFLQDFSSRDNLMLSVKADALRLSIKYD